MSCCRKQQVRDWFADVLEFHRTFDAHIGTTPQEPPGKTISFRIFLIEEESQEMINAIRRGDLEGVADGAADLIYVVLGTLASYGIDPHPIWEAVHEAHMAKAGGPVREDGKRLRPPGWVPPDIKGLLAKQGPIEVPEGEGGES